MRGTRASTSGLDFEVAEEAPDLGEAKLRIKFGLSAWYANEKDSAWRHSVEPDVADYSRLFLTRAARREIRQSVVEIREVLDGLEPTDRRLHDEIVQLVKREPRDMSET